MANRSSLDRLETETFTEFHGNGDCLVEDCVDSADHSKQKSLFRQVFSVYQEENCIRGNVRDVPVMPGDCQLLDLYQLFSIVKEKGGYAAVSRKVSWDSVIVDLGLDLNVLASVKLIYEKYLSDFEGWLSKTFEEKSFKNWNNGCSNSLPMDLEKELQSLLCSNLKDKDDHFVPLEPRNIIEHTDLVNHKSDGNLLDAKNQNNKCEGVQNFNGDGNEDDNEKFGTGVKDDLATSSVETSENEFHSRKRKRESLSGMINWTKNIAINPFDPEEYKGGQDFLVQMLGAREVLSVRKHAEPDSGSSSKKVKKMHPDMYEDLVVKLRCSKRRRSAKPPCSCCISLSGDVVFEKEESKPSVGHRFQAELPQCTGVVYESDSKCLGTQVWPIIDDSKPTTETDLVGRERRGKCSCNVQGSVDCVRCHIDANRKKLKLELGSAFYHWGFDKMGEEVSLRGETMRNRVTPETVDCNNEEVVFGSFGDGIGRKAIEHPSMDFMECLENTQCFDFE